MRGSITNLVVAHADVHSKVSSGLLKLEFDVAETIKKPCPYPYYDITKREGSIAMIRSWLVTSSSDNTAHLVVLSYRQEDKVDEYSMWCGDKFLTKSGNYSTRKRAFMQQLEETVPDMNRDAAQALLDEVDTITIPELDPCNFWALSKANELCSHTKAFLLKQTDQGLQDVLKELKDSYVDLLGLDVTASATSVKTGPLKAFSNVTQICERVAFKGAKAGVFLQGDSGVGKTTFFRGLAKDWGVELHELGCHEETNSLDLLGYDKGAVSRDGVISQAARRAIKTGKRQMVLLDEVTRMPNRQMSAVLTAFSPFDNHFVIRTNRAASVVDGVEEVEVLTVPCDLLFVAMTANVGSQFAVDEVDEAVERRFITMKMFCPESQMLEMIKGFAKNRKFSAKAATDTMSFVKGLKALVADSKARREASPAHIESAFLLANSEAELAHAMALQALNFVSTTSSGLVIKKDVEYLVSLLHRSYRAPVSDLWTTISTVTGVSA